ncbi:alpha-L-fucosidase [Trifolium repens]|nr:alpha-L-fucosidase [Trifolium repens]
MLDDLKRSFDPLSDGMYGKLSNASRYFEFDYIEINKDYYSYPYDTTFHLGSKYNLKVNYEANGWVAHQVSDIWANTSPDRGMAVWALWPMGGAWLCCYLWIRVEARV